MFLSFAELDVGFQGYGAYAGDMPMDGMEVSMMPEEYGGSMAYDRQPYPEYWPKGEFQFHSVFRNMLVWESSCSCSKFFVITAFFSSYRARRVREVEKGRGGTDVGRNGTKKRI